MIMYKTIDRIKRKLNARILLGEIIRHGPKVCVSAGTLVFFWRLICSFGFMPGASLLNKGYASFVFLALCAVTVPVIIALNRKRALTREGAAMWLDDRLGAKGIFSAALTCLSAGFKNDFSDRIIDEATRSCTDQILAQKNLFPRRVLLRRSLIAVSSLALMFLLLSAWNPRSAELAQVAATSEKNLAGGDSERENKAAQKPKEKMSDAELARNIFPEDNRLASLAEEAMKNGDEDALKYLMKQNGLQSNDVKPSSSGDEMKQNSDGLNNQQESAQSASGNKSENAVNNPDSKQNAQSDNQNKNQSQKNKKQASDGKDGNAKNEDQSKQGKQGKDGENLAPSSDEAQKNAEENKAGKTGLSGKGDKAGSGTADNTTGLASKSRTSGSNQAIKFRKDGSPLQFVLPGKQAKATMMQAVPSALRGSEAANGSSNTPLDYESFVQFYFSTLSKEMQK